MGLCVLIVLFSAFFPASVPIGRPEETVGAGHGVNDSSSQQLVSFRCYYTFVIYLHDSEGFSVIGLPNKINKGQL